MGDINNSLYRVLDKFKTAFGITTILPGSKLFQMAESIALESTVSEDIINNYVKENSLATATGYTLDSIGENFFGIKRLVSVSPSITSTMKALKFYTNNGVAFGEINRSSSGTVQDIVVPEGTQITGSYNGTSYTFRISKTITLSSTSNIAYADAEMSNGDNKIIPANTLTTHSFTEYTNAASKLLLVTNVVSIGSGRDSETDDNYRYRLINSIKANSSSSYFGIKNDIITIPGISNVEIINGAYGGGTFAVFVQGTTPITSDELIETVKDQLSSIVPAWCTYTVNKPRYFGLTMTVSINVGSGTVSDQTIQSINHNVSEYVNNFYGNQFRALTLQQIVMSSSSDIFAATLESLQVYSGSGDFRMYEDVDLRDSDPILYLSTLDKLIIEPNIVYPITITQVI
jgi:uncharacterized phage protein gp47/JayE